MKSKSFTLLELMIVLIIIGILATLGLVNYQLVIEKTYDDKAKSNLKLVRAAERIYRMEQQEYIACANTLDVNNNLRLSIPNPPTNPIWQYSVAVTGTGPTATFSARAMRDTADSGRQRTWCISQVPDADPCCSGAGCSSTPACPAGCP